MFEQTVETHKPKTAPRKRQTSKWPVAPVSVDPDAALLSLGKAMEEADAQLFVIAKQIDASEGDAYEDACIAWDQQCDVCEAIVGACAAIPARTLAGMIVKAKAVGWIHKDDDIPGDERCTNEQLAFSIVRDLLRMTNN